MLIIAGAWSAAPAAWAQPPLATGYAVDEKAVLPAGISSDDIVLSGTHAYTWDQPDGTNALSIYGGAHLRMGEFTLRSQDAVVWFRRRTWEDRPYYEMEIFLWKDAEVRQPGGTLESGPALIVTLNSFGAMRMNISGHVSESDEQSILYQRASAVRDAIVQPTTDAAPEGEMPVRLHGAPEEDRRIQVRPVRALRRLDYSSRQLISEVVDGERIVLAIGDVRISQIGEVVSEALELQADAAVLYLTAEGIEGLLPDMTPGGRADDAQDRDRTRTDAPLEEPPPARPERRDRETAREYVSAAYLEGDVVIRRGARMIRASRLYYDFEHDRALLVDVVMRGHAPGQEVPIYVRAEQVRQLSATEYVARRAKFSTSEFYTPHIALGATTVYLTDRTPRDESGQVIGIEAGTYRAYNTTLEMEGVPVLYWPFSQGDFSRDAMALRAVKVGYVRSMGAALETRWYLFNLLGLESPPGYDATLKLDYFTKRGPAAGIDVDYIRDDYFGLLRSYYIHDTGDDRLGPIRSGPPDTDNRGRVLWRHRQYLPYDWQLSLEASYISDDNFLGSFERNEWENAKDQETALFLLKRQDNWQFSTLFNWRILDFVTQTEHLPDAMFSLIGEPLTEFATFYHESRAGLVRYRPDDRRVFDSGRYDNTSRTDTVVRGDTRNELTFLLPELGPVKVTPYVMGRASAWDDSIDGGSEGRLFGSAGLRANMYFHKTYDEFESDLLDIHRVRHIIKPDVGVWLAGTNTHSRDLTPFDQDVETIDDFGGVTLGLRQRWQTKRGGPGQWQTVDWITWDVEAGFFNDKRKVYNPLAERTHGNAIYHRPEDSISSNFLSSILTYRLSGSTVVVYDALIDLNRGGLGTTGLSLNVERDPRLAYYFGWRYIHDTESNLIAFGANYRLNEKHTLAFRETYDIDLGRNGSTEIIYVRRWPRWYTAITFDVDRTSDDLGISVSAWPEGAPRLGLGSKRFTGLADSIGVRP
jgi:hypothetical protein